MRNCFLIDTHVLLWALDGPDRLSLKAKALIEDSSYRILVSHATIWELSIKVTINKISLPEAFFESIPGLGYELLTMTDDHFAAYRKLPLIHRDPFDRMLVAQCQAENLPLISCDSTLEGYGIELVW